MLEKKDEIVANVIWRFLELRGYVLFISFYMAFRRRHRRVAPRTGTHPDDTGLTWADLGPG